MCHCHIIHSPLPLPSLPPPMPSLWIIPIRLLYKSVDFFSSARHFAMSRQSSLIGVCITSLSTCTQHDHHHFNNYMLRCPPSLPNSLLASPLPLACTNAGMGCVSSGHLFSQVGEWTENWQQTSEPLRGIQKFTQSYCSTLIIDSVASVLMPPNRNDPWDFLQVTQMRCLS